jgi:hypothetical protein
VFVGAAAVSVTGAAPGTVSVGAARVTPAGVLAGGGWRGRVIGVPGRGSVNVAGIVYAVSCGAAGSCAAGGSYEDPRNYVEAREQGFVVSQKHGVWGKAIEVPGLGALNSGLARVGSVSCAAAGSCAAGGYYDDASGNSHGFVVSQQHGVWGKAVRMPGAALSPATGNSEVTSVSCGAPGSCAAAGDYTDRRNREQGFVASEKHEVWGKAIEVPGLGALNAGYAEVTSVSCAPEGSCAAGGDYQDASEYSQGFVVSEKHGVWGKAIEVPGLGALNTGTIGGVVGTESVSCAPAGSCAASGDYTDRRNREQGFVVSQQHGVWGKAIEVPGLGALNTGGSVEVPSVSCGPAGSCVAGGYYASARRRPGFVVSERNGGWGKAITMPGSGISAAVASVSCGPAGYCAAGGYAAASASDVYGFVVSERNGVWGKPVRIVVPVRLPGTPHARVIAAARPLRGSAPRVPRAARALAVGLLSAVADRRARAAWGCGAEDRGTALGWRSMT